MLSSSYDVGPVQITDSNVYLLVPPLFLPSGPVSHPALVVDKCTSCIGSHLFAIGLKIRVVSIHALNNLDKWGGGNC